MDGKRLQEYWSHEVDALIETYRQFETLIPSNDSNGSAHHGEDGRYVEDLLREYLSKYLPKGLEVLTGFILRPAVKTGENGRERANDKDNHSGQLDIIVYDSLNYPIFQRFGDSVIVPPEGVVGILSVKKHLYENNVTNECESLWTTSKLCKTQRSDGPADYARGPFLAIICMNSRIAKKKKSNKEHIFCEISKAYNKEEKPHFDDIVGYIGSLNEWSIFKKRPKSNTPDKAEFISLIHKKNESHLGLQFLLSGILSVYYDTSRRNVRRPGFTAFPSGRNIDVKLGEISCSGLR